MDRKRYSKTVPLCCLPVLERELKKKEKFKCNKIVPMCYYAKQKKESMQVEECKDGMGKFNIPNEIIAEMLLYMETFQEFLKFQTVNKHFKEITESMILRMRKKTDEKESKKKGSEEKKNKDKWKGEYFHPFFERLSETSLSRNMFIDYFINTCSSVLYPQRSESNFIEKQKEYKLIINSFKNKKDFPFVVNYEEECKIILKLYYNFLSKKFSREIFCNKSFLEKIFITKKSPKKVVFGRDFFSKINSIKEVVLDISKESNHSFVKYVPCFFEKIKTLKVVNWYKKDETDISLIDCINNKSDTNFKNKLNFDLLLNNLPKTINTLKIIKIKRAESYSFLIKKKDKIANFKKNNLKIRVYLNEREIKNSKNSKNSCHIL